MRAILPRGYVCPREIRFPVEKCCPRKRDGHPVELLLHSGWQPQRLVGAILRWVLFIIDYHPVSGKQKQSLQRQENWRYCSTMP